MQMFSGGAADSRNFRATFGILFFGVPNQGMDISSLLAMVRGQPNLHFLSTLSKDGGFLQGLIEKFRATFDFQDSQIYSFYETDMSPTAQEGDSGKWSMNGRPAVLVDRHSARSGRSWEGDRFHLPISRNHSDMVKFSDFSEDCGIVCDILRQFGEEARAVISRRWWWWEKEFSPKISFGGNPIFKMLFSDAPSLPPTSASKPQPIGSGALPNSSKAADSESDSRPRTPSISKSQVNDSATVATMQGGVGAASNMGLEVPTGDQRRANNLPNAISDESSNEESSQQAQLNINKTIVGTRRSYERVGVLFLTWQTESDRKSTDVSSYENLLTYQMSHKPIGGRIEGNIDDRTQLRDASVQNTAKKMADELHSGTRGLHVRLRRPQKSRNNLLRWAWLRKTGKRHGRDHRVSQRRSLSAKPNNDCDERELTWYFVQKGQRGRCG